MLPDRVAVGLECHALVLGSVHSRTANLILGNLLQRRGGDGALK